MVEIDGSEKVIVTRAGAILTFQVYGKSTGELLDPRCLMILMIRRRNKSSYRYIYTIVLLDFENYKDRMYFKTYKDEFFRPHTILLITIFFMRWYYNSPD